jgi:hypothetical protein
MDHSSAPEKQANSPVSRKSDGKAMVAGGIKSSQNVLRCPQMLLSGHTSQQMLLKFEEIEGIAADLHPID